MPYFRTLSPKTRELCKNLLLAVGSVILFLVLFEIAVRIFYPLNDTIAVKDDLLGWKEIPKKEGSVFGVITKRFSTNSEGFFDREHEVTKDNNTFRILVLGDSFIEGICCEPRYTDVLQKRLDAESKGRRYEVFNMGIGAYGMAQDYLALKYYGLKYRPDMVILGFTRNDVFDDYYNWSGDPERPYAFYENGTLQIAPPQKPRKNPGWMVTLDRYLKSPLFIRTLLFKGLNKGRVDSQFYENYYRLYEKNDTTEAWNLTISLIGDIKQLAEDNNASFLLLIFPNSLEVYKEDYGSFRIQMENNSIPVDRYDIGKPDHIITQFVDARKIAHINMLPVCKNIKGRKCFYDYLKDTHWNGFGNEIIANETFYKLRSSGVV